MESMGGKTPGFFILTDSLLMRTNMLLPIYECPVCGETWRIRPNSIWDTETDEFSIQFVCIDCDSEVMKQKYDSNGKPLSHSISDEELDAEDSFYNDLTLIDDDDLWLDPSELYNE